MTRRRTRLHGLTALVGGGLALIVGLGHGWQRPQAREGNPEPIACYEAATERTLLSQDQALRLCRGAAGTGPALCFEAADRRTLLSDDRMIELCRCAISLAPVTCYEQTDRDTFLSDDRIATLCSARTQRDLLPDCRERE